MTPEFERELAAIMRARGVANPSEVIQQVVHEIAEGMSKTSEGVDRARFTSPIAEDPTLPPRDDDELWEGMDPDADQRLLEKRRRAVAEMGTLYTDLHGLSYGRKEKEEMFRGMDV